MAELNTRHHGVSSIEETGGVRPITDLASEIIAIICTADDADPKAYPENVPVGFPSIDLAIVGAGAKGTLLPSLEAIKQQTNCPIIVVRVQAGATDEETIANIIGSSEGGIKKGINALEIARAKTGMSPRILGVPDFDSQLITADLAAMAKKLNAFAYAPALDDMDVTKVGAYREKFGSRELMLVDDHFTRIDPITGEAHRANTIARILGVRARLDQDQGWHKSISNTVVEGVTGIEKGRSYELTDPNTEANFLNRKDITTLVQDAGFRIWGNRTTSDDPNFSFEVATRTAQMIKITIANGQKWAIDRPMHATLIIDVMAGIQAKLDEWTRLGKILGGRVWSDPTINTKERVKDGKFRVDFSYMYVPPLENLEVAQWVDDSFIVDMVNKTVSFASDNK